MHLPGVLGDHSLIFYMTNVDSYTPSSLDTGILNCFFSQSILKILRFNSVLERKFDHNLKLANTNQKPKILVYF